MRSNYAVQGWSIEKLHNNVNSFAVFVPIIETNDIWMVKLRHDHCFTFEPRSDFVGCYLVGEHFDGHSPAVIVVNSFVNNSHSTLAHSSNYPVLADSADCLVSTWHNRIDWQCEIWVALNIGAAQFNQSPWSQPITFLDESGSVVRVTY